MSRGSLLLCALAWGLGAVDAHAADDAVKLEERAFAAIEREQWCLAMRLFESAQQQGPAVGLLQNAAQAAELGGDLGSALAFLDAIKTEPSAKKADKSAAAKRATDLTKRIAAKGAGTACPTLDELEPPPPSTTTPTTPPPSTTPPPPPQEPPPADTRVYGFVGAGAGAGLALLGGAAAAVGFVPFFEHADARAQIEAAEKQKADATALQERQQNARASWESYGQPLAAVGVGVAVVGVAVAVSGLGYALLAPAPAEEP